jgi:hypothetical protein
MSRGHVVGSMIVTKDVYVCSEKGVPRFSRPHGSRLLPSRLSPLGSLP